MLSKKISLCFCSFVYLSMLAKVEILNLTAFPILVERRSQVLPESAPKPMGIAIQQPYVVDKQEIIPSMKKQKIDNGIIAIKEPSEELMKIIAKNAGIKEDPFTITKNPRLIQALSQLSQQDLYGVITSKEWKQSFVQDVKNKQILFNGKRLTLVR